MIARRYQRSYRLFVRGKSSYTNLVDTHLASQRVMGIAGCYHGITIQSQPPPVLFSVLEKIYHLSITDDDYWERAGRARAILRKLKLKARTADALIAQSCIDHDVPLLTRDKDFEVYAKHCGLKLVVEP